MINYIKAFGIQFAYKVNHSTTLYSMIYLNTLHHDTNHDSNVYSCIFDASKAFDRIHYGNFVNFYLRKKCICVYHTSFI